MPEDFHARSGTSKHFHRSADEPLVDGFDDLDLEGQRALYGELLALEVPDDVDEARWHWDATLEVSPLAAVPAGEVEALRAAGVTITEH